MDFATSTRSPEGLLTLLCLRGIGPKSAVALAKRYLTLGGIAGSSESELRQIVKGSGLTSLKSDDDWHKASTVCWDIIESSHAKKIRVLSIFDSEYPGLLTKISDAPPILYAKGTLRNNDRFVACVGTREPSFFGEKAAERITKTLAEANWGIVSGLAIGVDSISHRAALDVGGYTVAILANGLDSVYPKVNQKLADEILDRGGLLLSEQPLGAKAMGQFLVQRDRLQSGMSLATFVMQTDIVGGTMHTVRFTLTQERLLFAPVPNGRHALEDKSQGIKALTELTGPQFADQIKADGEYRGLLHGMFADSTPAIPIESSEKYPMVLDRLAQEYGKKAVLHPVP